MTTIHVYPGSAHRSPFATGETCNQKEDQSMKVLFAIAALLIAVPFAFAQTTTTARASSVTKSTTETVNPPGMGTQNGITAVNGNWNGTAPEYAGSQGTVRLKTRTGDLTHSDVTTTNGTKCSIVGIETGDTVDLAVNNVGAVVGAGGAVTVASGSNIMVMNTAPVGGPSITVNMPGGSFTVGPQSFSVVHTN